MHNQTLPDPEADPEVKPSHLDFPVVGIGASAGGFDALAKFFEGMPAHPGMAFVVILHLSPKHESIADKILQRSTRMPVLQVTESVPLEKDHVYVISPHKQLAMTDGQLHLRDLPPTRTRHVAIDYFFRTLAEVHRERAVAIVLTGTGSDGSVGISRIREMGGLTFAQLPADAEYDDMPRSAIATGAVDIVLPAAEMPDRVLALSANAQKMQLPDPPDGMGVNESPDAGARQAAEEALRDIMSALRKHTGHDFRHYKRATVLRRIERRMQVNGMETLPAYRDFLHQLPAERPALLKDMLINVTNFFRDREAFDALEREVLPDIFASRAQEEGVRVWSAGCATGEEPYSLAMLLLERAAQERVPPPLQVFATDIDGDAIATARHAVYPSAIVTDVAPSRLSRFFGKEGDHYRVNRNVREKVLFARHNVLQDPPFSRLDLVCCRNLLIYLERKIQKDVLEMFHFALRPGGYLFLGSAESVDAASEFFTPVDKKNRIFRAVATRRARIHVGTPTALLEARGTVAPPPAHHPQASPLAEVHRRAIEQHAPPSVLVNREGNVLHMSERAGRFLRHVGGAPSLNLVALVLPELRLELRTALYQAMQGHQSVDSRRVRIMREQKGFYVNMTTLPVAGETPDETCFLVLFTEVECVLSAEGEEGERSDDPVLLQLEEELKRTREQLQGTIEHSENSHEELTASNEELQSINEELRSATEELETSKEELQSINEELITVNHELKDKVEETGKVNDDLQNLIASTEIATVFIDRGLCIKRYTPRATDVFSIIPADVGRSLLDITHRLDYEELAKDAIDTFQSLRTTEREVGSADGRWYIVRMLPYRTTEDRIDGAVITFIDITRRRQAEEEVHQNEERLRLVADSALDFAIITMDAQGVITGWSKGAVRLFGYTDAEAIGQSGDMLFTAEDRQKNAFEGELLLAREEGSAEDDRWHLRKNGERVFCSGTVRPMLRGGLHGYVKIARDVTGEKRQQREREKLLQAEQRAREAAQTAIEMKDEFLAVMSHELKHPLNLVLMNTELLARRPDIREDANGRRATEAIRRTVLNQAQIIDDLLDLSRLNTGKMTLRVTAVNLSETVRRITAAIESDLVSRELTLNSVLPAEDAWMEADPVRLDQVVWNLLNNAMKFTPKGGHIQVTLHHDEHHIELEVIDNGVGMAPEMLDRVFNMFEQASTRANRQAGGLGIGLALVRQLVELQDGEVKAYSDGPGKGTRMCVRWPLKPCKGAEAGPLAPSAELAGRRIVLVDDSVAILEPFGELLAMEGAEVQVFEDGPTALEYAQSHPIDVLFSDIGMPGMDGYELIGHIRKLPQHAGLLAIALTGFGRTQDGERAREAGFDAHIGKPIMMKSLMEALRRLEMERASG